MTLTTPDRTDALAERLFGATLGALELFSVYLGAELGLYRRPRPARAADRRPSSPTAPAIAPRYAREWLEQQAVAGLLDVDDADAAADARRYALAADHARVLVDPDDPAHVAPFAHMLAGIGGVLPRVAEAYRTGGGVPYPAYGARRSATARATSTAPPSPTSCPTDWLAAMPDVVARLERAAAPASPTSAAARAGRRSRSPTRSSTPGSTASTSTPPRSPTPAATPPRPASTAACASSTPTPPSSRARPVRPDPHPRGAARHDPTPSTRCAPPAPRSPPAAPCSSSTSASPTRSPPPATRSSG